MSLKAALNCDDVVVVHETSETIKEPNAALIETNTDLKVGQMCTNIQFYEKISDHTTKEVQIVHRLFLVNCYLLHVPRIMPSQLATWEV